MTRRTEIIAKRKLPEKIEKVTKAKIERREIAQENPQIGDKVVHGAQRAALAEAKKEVAELMGINPKKVNEAISNPLLSLKPHRYKKALIHW